MSDTYINEGVTTSGGANVHVSNTVISSAINVNVGSRVGSQVAQPIQPTLSSPENLSSFFTSGTLASGSLTALPVHQAGDAAASSSTSTEQILVYATFALVAVLLLLPPARQRPSSRLLI